jgi:hypothetical protein
LALLSALLLLTNTSWIHHSRQCRYYALSSFGLLATVCTFIHWRRGGRFGAPLFVLAGWVYFQSDFGSFFPAIVVMGLIAVISAWPRVMSTLAGFAVLGAAVAPFASYYEILDRVRVPIEFWARRFSVNLFNLNQYTIAAPVLALAAYSGARSILDMTSATGHGLRRHQVAMILWVPAVADFFSGILRVTPWQHCWRRAANDHRPGPERKSVWARELSSRRLEFRRNALPRRRSGSASLAFQRRCSRH